jgi:hypothetical protein
MTNRRVGVGLAPHECRVGAYIPAGCLLPLFFCRSVGPFPIDIASAALLRYTFLSLSYSEKMKKIVGNRKNQGQTVWCGNDGSVPPPVVEG